MSTLSPLSTLTSPTPSWHTATAGSPASNLEEGTTPSSPGDPVPSPPYRDARLLPRELKEHCQIYLEEQLYGAAIDLLSSLLCAGHGQPYASTKPALVPPPRQIALLATLAIHPTHTSRIAVSGSHDVSLKAITYLRSLLAIVGPVNANLRDAFMFRERRGRHSNNLEDVDSEDEESDEDHIRGYLANNSSVWSRGQDFWKVLGWAFNCSAAHPHRWKYWRPWLEYIVDTLDIDYEERKRLDFAAHAMAGGNSGSDYRHLQESLLVSYVIPKNTRSNPIKPIMSAIFADASESSLTLFKEIFEKERKGLSKNGKKRKREQLDLENDKFGDYYDDDSLSSSGGSEPPTPQKPERVAGIQDDTPTWTNSCLAESVYLRLRIFGLLSKALAECPGLLSINLDDLYIDFARRIKELPLAAFSLFISSQATPLLTVAYISLLRAVIPGFMPSSSPDPWKIDPVTDKDNGLSVLIMEKCFLPYAANTVGAEVNAKLSLVLEAMLRGLWESGNVVYSKSFAKAVEKGIQARHEKAKKKAGRAKGDSGDKAALEVLSASGRRLSMLVDAIEADSMEDDDSNIIVVE